MICTYVTSITVAEPLLYYKNSRPSPCQGQGLVASYSLYRSRRPSCTSYVRIKPALRSTDSKEQQQQCNPKPSSSDANVLTAVRNFASYSSYNGAHLFPYIQFSTESRGCYYTHRFLLLLCVYVSLQFVPNAETTAADNSPALDQSAKLPRPGLRRTRSPTRSTPNKCLSK